MEGPFLQFGLAPTKEGYESSGDLPRGYSFIVYPRENDCQAFFERVIVIFWCVLWMLVGGWLVSEGRRWSQQAGGCWYGLMLRVLAPKNGYRGGA